MVSHHLVFNHFRTGIIEVPPHFILYICPDCFNYPYLRRMYIWVLCHILWSCISRYSYEMNGINKHLQPFRMVQFIICSSLEDFTGYVLTYFDCNEGRMNHDPRINSIVVMTIIEINTVQSFKSY